MKIKCVLLVFVLNFSLFVYSQIDSCVSNVRLGISFPPIGNTLQMDFSEDHLSNLSVNMIRFAENWALREQVQGVYNWGPLDERFEWIEQNNYSALLTIQSDGPEWACNPDFQNSLSCVFSDSIPFRKYMDSLLTRYGNSIEKIQFGNEWHSMHWFVGYASDFIRAHNTVWESVQENAPHIEVVLGGFASGTMTALAACYGYLDSARMPDSNIWYDLEDIENYCNLPENIYVASRQDSILNFCHYDMVDMHLYDDVENWPLYYHIMDSITGGNYPIIVSEMGGPNLINELPYSDEFQASRLYQYISCVDSLNISEVYYFKLVAGGESAPYHMESGLIDSESLTEKPAYYIFKSMNHPCQQTSVVSEDFFSFTIFPNPASEMVYLMSDKLDYSVVVTNIKGQIVFANKNVQQIDVSKFSSGLYFIRVVSSDGAKNFKLMVE